RAGRRLRQTQGRGARAGRTLAGLQPGLRSGMNAVPVARLSSYYLFYYAALGAFTPYWSLFLTARGMSVTAISVMMGIWYATRIVAPTTWTSIAAASPHPIRWLRVGSVLTLLTFCAFLLPLPLPWMYPA